MSKSAAQLLYGPVLVIIWECLISILIEILLKLILTSSIHCRPRRVFRRSSFSFEIVYWEQGRRPNRCVYRAALCSAVAPCRGAAATGNITAWVTRRCLSFLIRFLWYRVAALPVVIFEQSWWDCRRPEQMWTWPTVDTAVRADLSSEVLRCCGDGGEPAYPAGPAAGLQHARGGGGDRWASHISRNTMAQWVSTEQCLLHCPGPPAQSLHSAVTTPTLTATTSSWQQSQPSQMYVV